MEMCILFFVWVSKRNITFKTELAIANNSLADLHRMHANLFPDFFPLPAAPTSPQWCPEFRSIISSRISSPRCQTTRPCLVGRGRKCCADWSGRPTSMIWPRAERAERYVSTYWITVHRLTTRIQDSRELLNNSRSSGLFFHNSK